MDHFSSRAVFVDQVVFPAGGRVRKEMEFTIGAFSDSCFDAVRAEKALDVILLVRNGFPSGDGLGVEELPLVSVRGSLER